ncbi:MAG: histidine phosphatase family protein [Candidatus Paceibacterota bacterium]|jgi:broad specificity phosphatase PhoE
MIEKENKNSVELDYVRHEKPEYTKEERMKGEYGGTLTEESRTKARDHAEILAASIDKDNELVIFWTSPKSRARQTCDIYKQVFQEKGIEVRENDEFQQTKESMRDVITKDGSMGEIAEKMKAAGKEWGEWMEYWTESSKLPKGAETSGDLAKRSARVIAYLERVARTVAPNTDKKLHFVCIGHEEGVRDLLEASLGQGTKKGTGPTYGEGVHAEIKAAGRSESGEFVSPAEIKVSFRGKEGETKFDPKTRSFANR